MKIDDFSIGEKIFIIAELSANHGRDIEIAKKSIEFAKKAGADAIKLQTYTADTLTIDSDKEYFRLNSGTIWDGQTLYDLYDKAHTPWDWHRELFEHAKKNDIICFSTPFDRSAVDFLEELNVPAYKVASFEIMDIPLIEYIASKGKPVIISTGLATLCDIEAALDACYRMNNRNVILLKCTSAYPAKIEDSNLKTIQNMKDTFDLTVGLSDHTLGITVPIISAAMGAEVIEKHFIIDKTIGGPDSEFSLDFNEFKQMVKSVREAELSIGKVSYELSEKKIASRILGRSLFVVNDIKLGEKLTEKNIRSIRPGYGISPKYYYDVIGKTAKKTIARGTPLKWGHFE